MGDHAGIVRESAQRVYQLLIQRARDERNRATLLRPTADPGASQKSLLRPVNNAGPADSSRLLRPMETTAQDELAQENDLLHLE